MEHSPDGNGNEGAGQGTECATGRGSERRRRDPASGYTKPLGGAFIVEDSG